MSQLDVALVLGPWVVRGARDCSIPNLANHPTVAAKPSSSLTTKANAHLPTYVTHAPDSTSDSRSSEIVSKLSIRNIGTGVSHTTTELDARCT